MASPSTWTAAGTRGGIAVSGLPAKLAKYNATYAPTGATFGGMPSFKSVGGLHLYYDEEDDGTWNLNDEPDGAGDAMLATGTGPVPLGARTWQAWDGEAFATTAKLTTREVA